MLSRGLYVLASHQVINPICVWIEKECLYVCHADPRVQRIRFGVFYTQIMACLKRLT